MLEGSGLEPAGNAAPDWPKTLAEAVDRIAAGLRPALVRALRRTECADLVQFHLGWGTWIRNHFGLWAGNDALLKDCGTSDPDECSMTILEHVWDLVNGARGTIGACARSP